MAIFITGLQSLQFKPRMLECKTENLRILFYLLSYLETNRNQFSIQGPPKGDYVLHGCIVPRQSVPHIYGLVIKDV